MAMVFNDEDFKTSSLCVQCRTCVAVAVNIDGVGIRDTKDPTKTTLNFTREEWQLFVEGAKRGEFDI
jgi:Domain of unknown function (DUF397)